MAKTRNGNQPDQSHPKCPGCGRDTNANGNCFNDSCWNANSKRHYGPGGRDGRNA